MARLNIYLQDDLAASVKSAGLEASAICQKALREAVKARGQGVGGQIEALSAALRLQRTTPQGRRAIGAADGARWAKEAATVRELRDINQLIVERLGEEDDEDRVFMVRWADATSEGNQNFLDLGERSDFETLGLWLREHGSGVLSRPGGDLEIDADEYLAGFTDAAQSTWRELEPLIAEDEAVLRRRIELLYDMERSMVVRDSAAATASAEGRPASAAATSAATPPTYLN
jgi:hypothetical protein